jgi:predicted acetyltransferase
VRIGRNFHSHYDGNIGYEIDEPYRGNGYAYEACLLVIGIARCHKMAMKIR